MKTILFFSCLLLYHLLPAQDLLSKKYTAAQLSQVLIPQAEWKPFHDWSKADPEIGKALIKKAEGYLNYEWPGIPAVKSLLIVRTGNRSEYEEISSRKREVLGTLLLAEVYEDKGRFIDAIINGVWSICEQSFWGVPAHLPKGKEYKGLIDVSKPFVELFSAETATYLAWVDYFLGEKLDSVSPQIRKRIYYETSRRVFDPLMTQHHGWMSKNANGRRPNNWNPWICSNWLNAVLLLEKDNTKRVDAVHKILGVLDEFLNPYPQDGGCDEGPGYWGAAAASLYDNISILNLASNNAFAYVYADKKVAEMGRFIYRAQISERYFINFADASPQLRVSGGMIYRYGKDIKDPDMMKFGAYYLPREDQEIRVGSHFFRHLFALFMQEEFKHAEKGLLLPADFWWPDLQVMMARDQQGSSKGFFVAVKGGNNDESHNHNDIGNYIVYYDGLPVLIDIGSGTYTAKTFSDRRYDIWYNRSDYHNVPTVNGYTQQAGAQFKAQQVAYNGTAVTMDISPSYPAAAGIKKWQRRVGLNRGKNVTIEDNIELKESTSVTEHLMTCYAVDVVKPGTLVIHQPSGDMYLHYSAGKFTVSIEKIPLPAMEDQGVKGKWGDNIYRINLNAVKPGTKDRFVFTVTAK